MQKFSFDYNAPEAINLGDVFYTVEATNRQYIYGLACPVCGDTFKVQINGFEFTCPHCHGHGNRTPVLTVDRYMVKRWRCVNASVGFYMRNWKLPENLEAAAEFKLCRTKQGDYQTEQQKVTFNNNGWKPSPLQAAGGIPLMRNYKEALKIADEKNAAEAAKIEEYNQLHGTAFQFEKPTYDSKNN